MHGWLLIFYLVLRAVNVPSIKKHRFLKRKVFVTVSSPETTAKTVDVPVEGQMAKWNQNMDALQVFLLSPQFYGLMSHSVLYDRLHTSYFVFTRSGLHIPTSL